MWQSARKASEQRKREARAAERPPAQLVRRERPRSALKGAARGRAAARAGTVHRENPRLGLSRLKHGERMQSERRELLAGEGNNGGYIKL